MTQFAVEPGACTPHTSSSLLHADPNHENVQLFISVNVVGNGDSSIGRPG